MRLNQYGNNVFRSHYIGEILGKAAHILCELLAYLINESLMNGEYPDILKISKSITEYTNKGSINDIDNYRNTCSQC